MELYELWRLAMYGVGVFVTCNVGGLALREATRRLNKRKPETCPEQTQVRMGVRTRSGVKVLTDPDEIATFLSGLSDADRADAKEAFEEARQTFDDIRRQVDGPEAAEKPQEA